MKTAIILTVIMCWLVTTAYGDMVILKTDRVLRGVIVEETDTAVRIKIDVGEITIPKEQIKSIRYDWLENAEKEYEKGNYNQAVEFFEKHLKQETEKTREREGILFKTGMCYIKLGQEAKALQRFEEFLKEYPESRLKTQVELETGKLYLNQEGRKTQAEASFKSAAGSHLRDVSGQAEYYLFMMEKDKKTEGEILKFCEEYIKKYPAGVKTPEVLYWKVETLYNRMPEKRQAIKNIPRHKEVTDLLEQVVEKKQIAGAELLQKTYYLMIDSYDKQARYPEKHNAMKQYATLEYQKDQEQQAQWLKQQADKLLGEGATVEAITLYRMTAKKYPETETAPETLFQIAQKIQQEEPQQGAVTQTIKEYEMLIKKYPKTEYAAESYLSLVKLYQLKQDHNKAIESLSSFLREYPENKKYESALFQLGLLYHQNKKEDEAKNIWNEYLKKYPEGRHASVVKIFYSGSQN